MVPLPTAQIPQAILSLSTPVFRRANADAPYMLLSQHVALD
jgi:hypothetical protein